MGMDVYGKAPTDEVGAYFRNNVWWWRPLWTYIEEIAPQLTAGVSGHYNDGEGLSAGAAAELVAILSGEIESGRTAEYEQERARCLASLPDEPCEFCQATGTRHDGRRIGRAEDDFPCNACHGKGVTRPWAASYPFSVDNVVAFRDFVAASGGFEIC